MTEGDPLPPQLTAEATVATEFGAGADCRAIVVKETAP